MGGQEEAGFYSRRIFSCGSGDLSLNPPCHLVTSCASLVGHVTPGCISGPICKLHGGGVGEEVENGKDIMVVRRIKWNGN